MATRRKCWSLLILLLFSSSQLCCCSYDYGSALTQSLLYFEASRSGLLPSNNRVLWRSNSALYDGKSEGVDLMGGYYVNGDNGKYGLPMAFAVTMLSWSVLEFGTKMEAAGELSHALYAIKWGTDYFIKCHTAGPNVYYAQVGEEWSEHDCWERPEDMDTSRKAYKIDQNHPGSDLAAETAAAFAAASIAFRATNPSYSSQLLNHAKLLFDFATKYQRRYQDSIPEITHLYQSNEYEDEQIWAAVWLYDATYDTKYIDYINQVYTTSDIIHPFNWDNKYPGIFVLVNKLWLKGKFQNFPKFRTLEKFGENFICNCLGGGPNDLPKTNGGLLYWKQSSSVNNLESVTCASFLVAVHAEALLSSGLTLDCFNHTTYTPTDLMKFVRIQVDYILGSNPNTMSYMVGFGPRYPQQVYHKGASIVSIKLNKTKVGCQEGWDLWEKRNSPNPNVLEGAIVGGPDHNDYFSDIRYIRNQTEPTLTTAAPFVGLLASLS